MTDEKDTIDPEELEKGEAEAKRRATLVHFIANNILNTAPLSKVVDLVKTAALNDATKLVEDADDEQLVTLEQQMNEQLKAEHENAQRPPEGP